MTYRPHYLGQLNWYNLNIACYHIFRAYGEMPYLVGSALERADYRDVDIRIIMDDERFAAMFPNQPADASGQNNDKYWAFTCATISEWLRARTGLPVDFQIQQMTAANALYDGKRNACGILVAE